MFVKSCDELLALLKDELKASEFPLLDPLENEAWKSSTVLSEGDRSRLIIIREQCNQATLNLATQIAEMKKCLISLEQLKLDQKPRLQKLDSALAPWRRIPPEVLSHIFEIHSEGSAYCISLPLPRQHVQPREPLPEHVCKFWQQVAFKTPALYKDIRISYQKYTRYVDGTKDEHELSLFASQALARARGTQQLSIDFGIMGTENCNQLLAQFDVMNPRIESLAVFHDELDEYFVDLLAGLLQQRPDLKGFVFEGYGRHDFGLLEDIPQNYWTGLSSLSISDKFNRDGITLSVETTHYLLARCPALRVCRLSIQKCNANNGTSIQHQPPPLADSEIVKLSCLQLLEVWILDTDIPRSDGPKLLRPLVLPSLGELAIHNGDGLLPSHIKSFLERSRCNLRVLLLTEFLTYHEAMLTELLPALPHTRSLLMPRTPFPPAILQRIASGEYLPKLEQLEMRANSSSSHLAILALADARWDNPNGGNIHRIRCWHPPDAPPDHRTSSWPFSPKVAMKFESQNRDIKYVAGDDWKY